MKVQFDKVPFLKALSRVSSVAEKKTTMPILGNILIQAKDQCLLIQATDLEIGIQTQIEAKVEEPGRICVPSSYFISIIKELPAEQGELVSSDQSWITIHSGKAQFKIAGVDGSEFPKMPSSSDIEFSRLQTNTLKYAIDRTSFAICTDEMRYNLNGSLIETETLGNGKKIFRMVATDGHRLAFYNKDLDENENFNLDKSVILPRKGVFELKKLLSDAKENEIDFAVSQGNAVCKVKDTKLFMRLVVGEFPDYTAVIPKNNNKKLTLEKESFYQSLRRVSLLSEGKSKCVKFGIHGQGVLLRANSPELGEAEEEIFGEFDGGELNIGFNAKYVLDALSASQGDKVVFEFNHEQSPGVVRIPDDPSYFGVIMPMRV
ncbi:MAG: DNA polymerase III subunit beta [Bdellovibrionales bacterium]|nr:DNA polymerase III subunit beta [Bdellovibrionales bacterium]